MAEVTDTFTVEGIVGSITMEDPLGNTVGNEVGSTDGLSVWSRNTLNHGIIHQH